MKSLLFKVFAFGILLIAFSCTKDTSTDLSSTDKKFVIPEISISKVNDRFISLRAQNQLGVAMDFRVQGNRRRGCTPCSWGACLCVDRGCDIIFRPADFWGLRETEPFWSLTSFNILNERQLEINIIAPDDKTLDILKRDEEIGRIFYLEENLPLDNGIVEALKLKKGTSIVAGEYPIKLSEKSPYGIIRVNIK